MSENENGIGRLILHVWLALVICLTGQAFILSEVLHRSQIEAENLRRFRQIRDYREDHPQPAGYSKTIEEVINVEESLAKRQGIIP